MNIYFVYLSQKIIELFIYCNVYKFIILRMPSIWNESHMNWSWSGLHTSNKFVKICIWNIIEAKLPKSTYSQTHSMLHRPQTIFSIGFAKIFKFELKNMTLLIVKYERNIHFCSCCVFCCLSLGSDKEKMNVKRVVYTTIDNRQLKTEVKCPAAFWV